MPETCPFDVSELRKCAGCGKGVLHTGNLMFYEVQVTRCIADLRNIQRMHGMEQMMHGEVALARMFSPSNAVAQRIGKPARLLFCMDCACAETMPVAVMVDVAAKDEPEAKT